MRRAALVIAAVLAACPALGAQAPASFGGYAFDHPLQVGETSVLEVRVGASSGAEPRVSAALDASKAAGKLKVYRVESGAFTKRTIPCSDAAYNLHRVDNLLIPKGAATVLRFAVQPCEDVPTGTYTLVFRLEFGLEGVDDDVKEIIAQVTSPVGVSVSSGAVRTGGEQKLSITITNRGHELLENVAVELASPLPGKLTFRPAFVRMEQNLPQSSSAKFEVVANATDDTPATNYPLALTVSYRTFETVQTVRIAVPDLAFGVVQGDAPRPELDLRDPRNINDPKPKLSGVLGRPFAVALPLRNGGKGVAAGCAVDVHLPKDVFEPANVSEPYEFRRLATEDVVHVMPGDLRPQAERDVRVLLVPRPVPTTRKGSYDITAVASCRNMAGSELLSSTLKAPVALDVPAPEFRLSSKAPVTVVRSGAAITAILTLEAEEELSCTLQARWPPYLRSRLAPAQEQWSAPQRVNGTYERSFAFDVDLSRPARSEHDIVFSASCLSPLNVTASREARVALVYSAPAGTEQWLMYGIGALAVVLVALVALLGVARWGGGGGQASPPSYQ